MALSAILTSFADKVGFKQPCILVAEACARTFVNILFCMND